MRGTVLLYGEWGEQFIILPELARLMSYSFLYFKNNYRFLSLKDAVYLENSNDTSFSSIGHRSGKLKNFVLKLSPVFQSRSYYQIL